MSTENQQFRDPSDLRLHAVYKILPPQDKDSDEFKATVDDIHQRGIVHPIIVDQSNAIMDGRDRWTAAKMLQLEQVPVIVRQSQEAEELVMATLCHRRHHSPGLKAYIAARFYVDRFYQGDVLNIVNGKKGHLPNVGEVPSQFEFASKYGVSTGYFEVAIFILKKFAENPALRERFEPEIWEQKTPLPRIKVGLIGYDATNDKPRATNGAMTVFRSAWTGFRSRCSRWQDLSPQDKKECEKDIAETFIDPQMPDELLGRIKAAVLKAEKERSVA